MSKNINDNGTNEFNFTGTDFIDSILQSEKKRWTLLPGNVITYSFINPESELLYPDEFKSVTSLNSIIQGYFTDILKNVIGSVISVDFTFKPERVSKNEDGVSLETTDFGTLRIMGKKFNDSSTLGMGKFPGSELSAGDLYLNSLKPYDIGTLGYSTILHELGHTLGLKHPFGASGKVLSPDKDNNSYTLMTYNDGYSYGGKMAISLMPYDILALQHLYGAREKNSGNTTYVFDQKLNYSVNGKLYYSFGSDYNKSTLWDSGGVDTLDFSSLTSLYGETKNRFDYRLDINEGGFLTNFYAFNSEKFKSYNPKTKTDDGELITTHKYGVALAYSPLNNSFDATIENLLGSQGNDYIVGNNVANLIKGNAGDDTIYGNAGDDTICGGNDRDSLFGGAGSDYLYGENQNDYLDGGNEDNAKDYLYGGDGDDELKGFGGDDELRGEGNNDTLWGGEGIDTLYGGGGRDYLYGQQGTDYLYGENGNDYLDGGNEDNSKDYLYGGNGDDTLWGRGGNDELHGEDDNDTIYGEDGNDVIYGGDGWDTLHGGANNDEIHGDSGWDTIFAGSENDTVYGDDGNDLIWGESGTDTIYGGAGLDIINGGDGDDTIYGDWKDNQSKGENDIINGDDGSDTIHGGGGWDVINGGKDKDYLYGDDGNDIIYGGSEDDFIDGGSGWNLTIKRLFSSMSRLLAPDSVTIAQSVSVIEDDDKLYGEGGNDEIHGRIGNDFLDGGADDDRLFGEEGEDTLEGGTGNDSLEGGAGNDILRGGSGNDRLFGQIGNDELYGEGGDDFLSGGEGSDLISGGEGKDVLSYADSKSGVFLSLKAGGWGGDAAGDRFEGIEDLELTNYDDYGIGDDNNNAISGLNGNDILEGYAGDDTLDGGNGTDRLVGGLGNDTLLGGEGNDTLIGELGNDTLIDLQNDNYFDAGEGNNKILAGNGNDIIITGPGSDLIDAGNGNNQIYGGEGTSTILTGNGNDIIYGGNSSDNIFSGSGNDIINLAEGNNLVDAGAGNNTIHSGWGKDLFVLATGTGHSTIVNFQTHDRFGLIGGLSFTDLTITQGNDNQGLFSRITIAATQDILADIRWTQPNLLTRELFVNVSYENPAPNLQSDLTPKLNIASGRTTDWTNDLTKPNQTLYLPSPTQLNNHILNSPLST